MRRRGRNQRRETSKTLIVCEGKITEVKYIESLRRLDEFQHTNISVKTIGVGKDPMSVLNVSLTEIGVADSPRPRSRRENYDWRCIIIDVDEHKTLSNCLNQARKHNVEAVVSNPCFEIWLLWHFEDHHSHITAQDLRRKLEKLGHHGKSISRNFPVQNFVEAQRRARTVGKHHQGFGKAGTNPSSSMPDLIDLLLGKGS